MTIQPTNHMSNGPAASAFFALQNEQGQSAVEYIVLTTAILVLFCSGFPRTIYDTVSHTMQDKYNSYAFGISISDPPSKKFDDAVKKDADKAGQALDTLRNIGKLITDSILPAIGRGELPSMDSIEEFVRLVKSLF